MNRLIIAFFLMGLTACTTPSPAEPDGRNRVLDIVNDTPLPVLRVYGKAQGGRRSVITEAPIAPRGYISINFANPANACVYDLVAEFQGEREAATISIDVCAHSVWRVH